MPLETAAYIHDLVTSNPAHDDQLSAADAHIRLIKQVLLSTFPNMNAPVTASPVDLNNVATAVASLASQITAEIANRNTAVTNEAASRSTAVTNEAAARLSQDTAINQARVDGDASLQTLIANESAARSSQDIGINQARVNGDAALQTQIDTITGSAIPTLFPWSASTFTPAGNGAYLHLGVNGGSGAVLIQAGYSGALATGTGDGVPFPVPFPNAVYCLLVSNATPGSLTVSGTLPTGSGPASGFLAYAKVASTASPAPGAGVFFIAVGW